MTINDNRKESFLGKASIVFLILSAVMLLFIWIHSMMSSEASADESAAFLEMIFLPILRLFTDELPKNPELLVRKLAHFSEYAVFAWLLSMLICSLRIDVIEMGSAMAHGSEEEDNDTTYSDMLHRIRYFYVVPFCFAVAFIDETIQIFSGRGPAIVDVWIDVAGATLGFVIGYLVAKPVTAGRIGRMKFR